jgi:ABC-type lipoprotein export system ATPase subunit
MTILVGDHDPVIASRCDRIVRLHDGRIVDQTDVGDGPRPEAALERIRRLDAP